MIGHEGEYEVSNLGRVRSLDRAWEQVGRSGTVHTHRIRGRILRPGTASHGYPMVMLGRGNNRLVHRLVAEAFIGPCPEGYEVMHLDGERHDPSLSNLTYGTRSDNINHAVSMGRWGPQTEHAATLRSYPRG